MFTVQDGHAPGKDQSRREVGFRGEKYRGSNLLFIFGKCLLTLCIKYRNFLTVQ